MEEKYSLSELKKFKITLLFLPIIPDIILFFKGHLNIAIIFTIILWGTLFVLLSANLLGKNIDKHVYKFVKILLKCIGAILSSIALIITWFFTILPVGIIAKFVKRDRLRLQEHKQKKTYWIDYVQKEQTYENQY